MKTIQLSNGATVLVDDVDFEKLAPYRWHQDSKGYAYRQKRCGGGKRISERMHRVILSHVTGRIDHKNRNTLDNQRLNLRPATQGQNQYNRTLTCKSTSGHKGVYWKKSHSKWLASIGFNGKQHYLGLFDTPEAAAEAYNTKATLLHGEFSYLKAQESK